MGTETNITGKNSMTVGNRQVGITSSRDATDLCFDSGRLWRVSRNILWLLTDTKVDYFSTRIQIESAKMENITCLSSLALRINFMHNVHIPKKNRIKTLVTPFVSNAPKMH